MTENKARKRDVRARMTKTGERYTTAKLNLEKPAPRATQDLGKSDAAIRKGSGKGWDDWVRQLDRWGASERSHTEIARHVRDDLGVDGWWAQAVTVGYERARGMRAVNQRADGFFEANVSKTVPVAVERLRAEIIEPQRRNRWLEAGTIRVRPNRSEKSARFDFLRDGSRVHAYLESKGPEKSTVTIQHERLGEAAAVEEMRAFWKERLASLAAGLRERRPVTPG